MQQLLYRGGGIAQILGDELQIGEPAGQSADQRHAGALAPFAVAGGRFAVGHGPIGIQPAEMVDADHVVQLARAVNAADPPAVAVRLHGVPAIQGRAPQLAVRAEIVRRHAADGGGDALVVQLEKLRLRPYIGAVHRHIDGQVADHLNVQAVQVVPQRRPLLEEQELDVDEQLHILPQLCAVFLQHLRRFPQAQCLIGPLRPRLHAEVPLAGHVEGIILQPAAVLLPESGHGLGVTLPATLFGGSQHLEAALIDLAVVHIARLSAPLTLGDLALFQQTVGHQHVQIDEVGISGEGGKALVGGVAVAGGAKRQHLPIALPCGVEEVGKFIGCLTQRADAIGRRQGGDSKQNTTGTFHSNDLSLVLMIVCNRAGWKPRPADR